MTTTQKVTWLSSGSHFFTHSFMSLLPAVLVAISGEHTLSFMTIGIIANVGYFLYGLGAFPVGWLADRYGSKRILTIGVAGMALSSILVGAMPGAVGFAVSYALLGIFASIHHPAGLSLIARRVTVKGKALAVHGVLGNIGLFMAPLAAGLAAMAFGTWRAAYLLYGAAGVVFAIVFHWSKIEEEEDLSLSLSPERLSKARLTGDAGGNKKNAALEKPGEEKHIALALLVLFCGSILSGLIFRGSLTYFPLLLQREVHFIASHDEPVMLAGVITTAILSFGIIGAWFGGWINDKIKLPEIVPIVLFVVVTPALYFMSRWMDWELLAVGAVFSLFYYAWQPSQNYLIAKYSKMSSQGKGFGISFFLLFGMGSVATALGGYVSDKHGVDTFYGIMAWVSFVSLFVSLSLLKARSFILRFPWKIAREGEERMGGKGRPSPART